jgi:hypothetical protein
MANPPPLNQALRKKLRQSGISISALADALGEPRAAVYSWFQRNTWPANRLPGVLRVAGEDPRIDTLPARFSFTFASPRIPVRVGSAEASNAGSPDGRRSGRLDSRLTEVLENAIAGDLLCQILVTEPPEWEPQYLQSDGGRVIIDAIERGVEFAFLVPEDATLEEWARSFQQKLLPKPGHLSFGFARFLANIESAVGNRIAIDLLRSPGCPYFCTTHAYALLLVRSDVSDRTDQAFVRFPSNVGRDIQLSSAITMEMRNLFESIVRRSGVAERFRSWLRNPG